MKKMKYSELKKAFVTAEKNGEHISGCIVFTPESFDKEYSEESRTYKVSSNNKAFQPRMCGYSIYGSSLDGTDRGVRLEQYMYDEYGGDDGWKVEYCYID